MTPIRATKENWSSHNRLARPGHLGTGNPADGGQDFNKNFSAFVADLIRREKDHRGRDRQMGEIHAALKRLERQAK